MRKMTLKTLVMSLLMIFVGWQSFGQTTKEVIVLADNRIEFTAPGIASTDSVGWFINGVAITNSTPGVSFLGGSTDSILRIDGSSGASATAGFKQIAGDSTTAQYNKIQMVVYNAGGCYTEDTSEYKVLVLPYLPLVTVDYDSIALCEQTTISDSMSATKPTLTIPAAWTSSSVSLNFDWYYDHGTTLATNITTGVTVNNTTGVSKLVFSTPTNTDVYTYYARLKYDATTMTNLITSGGTSPVDYSDGAITSKVNIQAFPTPTAPTLNGTTSPVSGW